MILEALACLAMGIIRRVDGMDKSKWQFGATVKLLTRVLPIFICIGLVAPYVTEWWNWIIAVAFGGAISGSLQRGYDGWEKFSLRQITQHLYGMVGYGLLYIFDPWLTVVGIVGCLLAGLVHPVLARTNIRNYTEYAEFLTGFFIILPFVLIRFLPI